MFQQKTYFTNYTEQIKKTKLFGNVIDFKNILMDDFQHRPFLYQSFVNITFYGAENNKLKGQGKHSNICLLLTIIYFILILIWF